MLNQSETDFINFFEQTCKQKKVPVNERMSAVNAVREIFRQAVPRLQIAPAIAGIFPNHGQDHVVRLAGFYCNFMCTMPDLKPVFRDIDFLVLLFTSCYCFNTCVLQLEDSNILEFIKEHISHAKHHKCSLIRIEMDLNPATNAHLHQWKAFWERPDHGLDSKDALLMLLRICQSHGDPEKDFFDETSMWEYTWMSTPVPEDFPTGSLGTSSKISFTHCFRTARRSGLSVLFGLLPESCVFVTCRISAKAALMFRPTHNLKIGSSRPPSISGNSFTIWQGIN